MGIMNCITFQSVPNIFEKYVFIIEMAFQTAF